MSGINCSIAGATYQAPTPTFAVAAAGGATSINEGSSLTFNVTGTNIVDGTYFFAVNTNAIDFSPSSGSFTITSNTGSFSLTPTADVTTEGAETFTVSVRTTSTSGTIVATSASITINDTSVAPSYAIATAGGVVSINEGSNLTFNVTTTNVPNGTTLYWAINFGSAVAGDFSSTSGSFTITSNAGSFIVGPVADLTTEGAEAFSVSVGTGPVVGATTVVISGSITINDTSTTPVVSATVTPVAFNINEGSTLTINVATTNFTSGTLYWTTSNTTDFATISGSFTITSSAGSFTVGPTADVTTEGAETFTVSVRTTSTSGTIVGTSSSITINDTSTAPVITTRADAYASFLRLALPFSTQSQKDDVAFRVSGSPNGAMLTPFEAAGGTLVGGSKFYTLCYQPASSGIGYAMPVVINTSSTFFIEFWAKTTSTDTNNWVFSNDHGSAREWTIGLNVGGGMPSNITTNVGNGRIGGVPSGSWNHYAFSNANWWFNGTRRGTVNWGGSGYTATNLWIGRQKDYTIFNGQLQDFRIYLGTNKGVTTGSYSVPLSILT